MDSIKKDRTFGILLTVHLCVLMQTEPPDDEHLLLETCRGVKIRINTFRKECVRLVIK